MREDEADSAQGLRARSTREAKRQFIDALTDAVQGREPATEVGERLGRALELPAIYPRTVAESMAAPAWRRIDFRDFREQLPLPLHTPYRLGTWMSPPPKRALATAARAKALSKLASGRYGTRFWTAADLLRRPPSDEIDAALLRVVEHDPEESVRGIAALALAVHRFADVQLLALNAATANATFADDEAVLMAVFAAALSGSWERRQQDVESVMKALRKAEERRPIARSVRDLQRQLSGLAPAGQPVLLVREMLDPV